MKKNVVRGFTLVELIVVMAIMTILMAAIMHFVKPVRSTYIDTIRYESQRNVHDGIEQYITESVRYATDIGFYNSDYGSARDVVEAEEDFLKSVTGLTPQQYASLPSSDPKKADYENKRNRLDVITIDNSTLYTYGGYDYTGRIIRKKVKDPTGKTEQLIASTDEKPGSATGRLALGEGFYGDMTYSITLGTSVPGELTVYVSNVFTTSSKSIRTYDEGDPYFFTNLTVALPNISLKGSYDSTDYDSTAGHLSSWGKSYIVFLNPQD